MIGVAATALVEIVFLKQGNIHRKGGNQAEPFKRRNDHYFLEKRLAQKNRGRKQAVSGAVFWCAVPGFYPEPESFAYMEKLDPQPQVLLALAFTMLKPVLARSSSW